MPDTDISSISIIELYLAFALSSLTNPRNLECGWHGFWHHAMFELAVQVPRSLPITQMTLSVLESLEQDIDVIVDEDEEDKGGEVNSKDGNKEVEDDVNDNEEMEGDGDNEPEEEEKEKEEEMAVDDESGEEPDVVDEVHRDGGVQKERVITVDFVDDHQAGNETFDTVHGATASRVPDITLYLLKIGAIRWVRGKRQIRIAAKQIAILVEQKRRPSRSFEGAKLRKCILKYLFIAKEEVSVQAVLAFEEDPDLNVVMLIATSGDYWSHATMTREEAELFDNCPDAEERSKILRWSPYAVLGSVPSTARMKSIKAWLKRRRSRLGW